MSPESPLRILALGDSYTIGEGVAEAERWPNQLVTALREREVDVADPQIIATTGWTTDELADAIAVDLPTPPYALVSLLIGVNNQYRGRSITEYREQFSDLLQQAIGFANDDAARVIVLSIPDWGVTGFATDQQRDAGQIAAEIDAYNNAAADVACSGNIRFVDITELTRQFPTELVDDALHPSAAQYARWVQAVLPQALAILAKPLTNRIADART